MEMPSSTELWQAANTVVADSLEDDVVETATRIAERDKALVQARAIELVCALRSEKTRKKFRRCSREIPLCGMDIRFKEWTDGWEQEIRAGEEKLLQGLDSIRESTISAFHSWQER